MEKHQGGRKMNEMKRKAVGFTLIELLIVVAIIAILAAIAVPNFMEAQVRAKVSRTQNDLRSQAVALEAYYVDWNKYTRDSDSVLDASVAKQPAVALVGYGDLANGIVQLTTPIAYISGMLSDPFAPKGGADLQKVAGSGVGAMGYRIASGSWSYGTDATCAAAKTAATFSDEQNSMAAMEDLGARGCFMVMGVGPDQVRCRIGYKCFPFMGVVADAEVPATAATMDDLANANVKKDGAPSMYTSYDSSNGSLSKGDIYRFGGSYTEGRFAMDGKVVGMQGQMKKGDGSPITSVWNPAN
jgi:prepilin-type N-terminal cleavage/methylation domain-containing protein